MNKPKAFIYPGDSYHAAIEMFERRGFEVLKYYGDVDLVCFLGGTDVDPKIYGEERHPMTQSPDVDRDALEVSAYEIWKARGVPMVGICRGGQLLNVLNGGEMVQHLGYTVSGDVTASRLTSSCGYQDVPLVLRVDHHQGIIGGVGAHILCALNVSGDDSVDYALYYEDTKSLCFQGHPEWGHAGTEEYFFELVDKYLVEVPNKTL